MTWPAAMALGALAVLPVSTAGQQPAPEFLITVPSAHDFETTVATLKRTIESENLMVVHEVDAQQMLRMVNTRVGGMRQILFFHPRYLQRILEANRNGGIEPPLKVLVMEMPDGRVMVRYHDPVHQFAPYPGLEPVATELRDIVARVVASVSR